MAQFKINKLIASFWVLIKVLEQSFKSFFTSFKRTIGVLDTIPIGYAASASFELIKTVLKLKYPDTARPSNSYKTVK